MTHADAFLRDILAAPEDDAPRLVYADWLDERNDLRGEFIRVQCAIEKRLAGPCGRVPENSPWVQGDSVYHALRRRERELLEARRKRPDGSDAGANEFLWLGSHIFTILVTQAKWEWCRGFVERVECTAAAWLAHGPALVRAAPLTRVGLSDLTPAALSTREGFVVGTGLRPSANDAWGLWLKVHDHGPYPLGFNGFFESEQAAADFLSAACLAWARAQPAPDAVVDDRQ